MFSRRNNMEIASVKRRGKWTAVSANHKDHFSLLKEQKLRWQRRRQSSLACPAVLDSSYCCIRAISEVVSGRWHPECAHFAPGAARPLHPSPHLPVRPRLRRRLQRPGLRVGLARRAQSGRGSGDGAPRPALSRHAGARPGRRAIERARPARASICCCRRGAAREQVADNLGLHPRMLQRAARKGGPDFRHPARRRCAASWRCATCRARPHNITAIAPYDSAMRARARSPAGSPPNSAWRPPRWRRGGAGGRARPA